MQISFTRTFTKQYKKAPKIIQKKFKECLKIFMKDEFFITLNNHNLKGNWGKHKSINITGDYRAIYTISEKDVRLFFALGTHSQLYT